MSLNLIRKPVFDDDALPLGDGHLRLDRLDFGRVGIAPHSSRLCTDTAKKL